MKSSLIYRVLLISIIILLFSALASAIDENDCVYYFYGKDCIHCTEIDQKLNLLKVKYPGIDIHRFEVYFSPENVQKLNQYFTAYNIPTKAQGLPAIFMPGSYLIGDESIQNLLEGRIINNHDPSCPSLEKNQVIGITGDKSPSDVLKTLTPFRLLKDAIKDSLRPVNLVMLILLLALLLLIRDEKKIVTQGSIFVIITYILYLLYGVGYFSSLSSTLTTQYYISKTFAVLAILLGFLLVTGFIDRKRAVSKHVSEEKLPKYRQLGEVLSSPLVTIAIALIGFIALSNTHDVYLILQTLLIKTPFRMSLFIVLLFYIGIIIIPLVAAVIIMHKAALFYKEHPTEKVHFSDIQRDKWKKHNYRVFSFWVGAAILGIGVLILLL